MEILQPAVAYQIWGPASQLELGGLQVYTQHDNYQVTNSPGTETHNVFAHLLLYQ